MSKIDIAPYLHDFPPPPELTFTAKLPPVHDPKITVTVAGPGNFHTPQYPLEGLVAERIMDEQIHRAVTALARAPRWFRYVGRTLDAPVEYLENLTPAQRYK